MVGSEAALSNTSGASWYILLNTRPSTSLTTTGSEQGDDPARLTQKSIVVHGGRNVL